jgi:hypothetical protein
MMRLRLMLPLLLLTGCLQNGAFDSSRFDPAQRLSPTAFVENATMKDTSIHEDPALLKVGVTRDQISSAFGLPNATSDVAGTIEDEYDFNPDGSKFVKPKIYARNIAAGVFTAGLATVAHQARIHHAESELTVYRLTYGPDGRVVAVDKTSAASNYAPTPNSLDSAPDYTPPD